MKPFAFVLLLVGYYGALQAQPTQAEIDKLMKQAKDMMKEYGIDEKDLPKNGTTTGSTKPRKFPERQTNLLNALPKKILSAAEVKQYAGTLYGQLQTKLPAAKVKAASTVIQKLGTQYEKIAAAGITAWYKNAPAEAALLTSYASSKLPTANILSNCAAVLTLCGLESSAIPVLKHVLQQQPNSSTVLNNLGQAYAGLGATDTAMYYLVACMARSGNHPMACATAYYIEMERGNIEKALEYAEKSLRSSYDEWLAGKYKRNAGDLWKTYKDRMPKKQYFDLNDFVIPPNTRSWQQSVTLYPKQKAYEKKLEELGKTISQESIGSAPAQSTNAADYIKWSQTLSGPRGCFAKMALAIRNDMGDYYLEERGKASLQLSRKMYDMGLRQGNAAIAFEQKWGALTRNVTGRQLEELLKQKCKEKIEIDNANFTERSLPVEKFKNEWYPKDVEFYNNYIFLATLINPNENALKMDVANGQRFMLNAFKSYLQIVVNPVSKPDCSAYDAAGDDAIGAPKFNDADCPINLEIPFVIGKMNLDCKKFGIEAGEGIIINYTKDFISRNSTLAIGIGAGISIPGAGFMGGQSVGEAGAKSQFYVTFDGNNQPVDGGLIFEAGAGIPGVTSTSAGYTLGVNSGFNFEPGPLSGVLR